jgi:hypothetical protein
MIEGYEGNEIVGSVEMKNVHPHDAAMIEMMAEGPDEFDALIPILRAEWERSLTLHPPREWAEMTLWAMTHVIRREYVELYNARRDKDIDGAHGMKAEGTQTAVTCLRMVNELTRRGNDTHPNL